ncbi:MAG: CCA tRNA nucleotidyltransferase, partial [Kiritimatiellaceae bacterium]|nr:CCA tRNA nucleotidyltransferase [Kiritimatiellaceae bacterium]
MNYVYTTAFNILSKIREEGFIAYFAGGAVRDQILGRQPKDYDIATNALPDQIEALFPKTVAIGKAFGVIIVVQAGIETEVATFREDVGYQDGRRPESVLFCGAKEDAIRRDFTINGMFYDPIEDEIIDYVGGQEDLKNSLLRAIGDPTRRFAEDHLRMLRAVRFAHTLGFKIDPATREAILAQADDLANISIERIENEFSRILTESQRPGDALRDLVDLGLMKHIIPEILPMIGQEQPPEFHPEGDVFEHTTLMLNLMNKEMQPPS